ncbi:MAG: hypothetical protein RLY71_2294 [Pseudomonadota bacterium]|jgi:hypothetical protein
MALPDAQADALMQRFGSVIATLARAQLDRVLGLIAQGADPREAIATAQAGFTGEFADRLAQACSELLQRVVGVAEVKDMPVGGLSLSRRLYDHNRQTTAEALAVIREHAQGLHQARDLALRLYDGYDPKDGVQRPLEGRARGELPKALRQLTGDPQTRKDLAALVEQGQQQASRLKTGALRAAYSEAIDAWKAGKGEEALNRRLEVAVREKNRYMANRIAQTELARAHQAQVAAEFMADDQVEVVQVMINPTHPRMDVCDLHGRADLFGLGRGCYPKAKAPQPPYHPFCRCALRQRPSLRAADARPVPGGEAAYLRELDNLSQAGQVMGSRERAERVMKGEPFDQVINAAKDPLYRLRRLGDPAAGHVLVRPLVSDFESRGGRFAVSVPPPHLFLRR